MRLLQLMGRAGEERRRKSMQDGQREHAAGDQQETILLDGRSELRPEIRRRGHTSTKPFPNGLAISSAS